MPGDAMEEAAPIEGEDGAANEAVDSASSGGAVAHTEAAHERVVAVRSAMILGTSLLLTWTVGLLVRLYLPRFMGVTRFGEYSFAETFPYAFFGFLGLGVETYIQKEIPVRPEHASDFFGGVFAVRALLSVGLFAAMAVALSAGGRSGEVQLLVFIFGVAQFFLALNGTLAALLQAARTVGGLAAANVVGKIVWGVGIAVAVAVGAPLAAVAGAFCFSEALKSIWLFRLARRELRLRVRVDLGAARTVVIAALPYYVNSAAIAIYSRIDVTIVSFRTNDDETGWYASAQNIAGLTMLLAPVLGSVLTPLMSRVASRSHAELGETLRSTLRVITSINVPVTLMMFVGAPEAVRYGLGARFAPATTSVAILAPMFVLTYYAMILSVFLMMIERPWTVTVISLCALVLDAAANYVLAPRCLAAFGPGGAGIGGSVALLVTEVFVVFAMMRAVGFGTVWDKKSAVSLGKSLAVALVVVAADRQLRFLGAPRLALDGLLYLALAVPTKTLDVRQVFAAIRAARRGAPAS